MSGWNDNPEQPPRVRVMVIAAEGTPQPGTLTSDEHGDVIELDGDELRDELHQRQPEPPEPAPDAHLEMAFEDRVSGDLGADPYDMGGWMD